jgi:hypothetical protein
MKDIQKTVALVLGIVFTLVGILGFVPPLVFDGALLGIFAVNLLHNIVHLVVGILGFAAAYTGFARLYNQVIGLVYLLLGIIGFIPGLTHNGALLHLVSINLADNLLHLVVGTAVTFVGFAVVRNQPAFSK